MSDGFVLVLTDVGRMVFHNGIQTISFCRLLSIFVSLGFDKAVIEGVYKSTTRLGYFPKLIALARRIPRTVPTTTVSTAVPFPEHEVSLGHQLLPDWISPFISSRPTT